MLEARLLEIRPQLLHQHGVVEQHGALLATLAHHPQMLVVTSKLQIAHMNRERLADS